MPGDLLLLRHGESEWNATDRFAGWVDVPLTEVGRRQASEAGLAMARGCHVPDVVHTSLLERAVDTATLALDAAGARHVPIHRTWRLNERHYGALQGRFRDDVRREFGVRQTELWRRSFTSTPPPIPAGSPFGQDGRQPYQDAGIEAPRTESIADVVDRLVPYWDDVVTRDLRQGRTVLVVGHGNSLRALLTHLQLLRRDALEDVELGTGIAHQFVLDDRLHLTAVAPGRKARPRPWRAGPVPAARPTSRSVDRIGGGQGVEAAGAALDVGEAVAEGL